MCIFIVLIKNQFECTQYFEDINKSSCWTITQDIRQKMYKMILIRNYGEKKEQSQEEINSIEEIVRNDSVCSVKNIPVTFSYTFENISPDSVENCFNEYLNMFKSNTPLINALPYYLIPVTASLRYLLIEKLNINHFIFKDNDKLYSHLINATTTVTKTIPTTTTITSTTTTTSNSEKLSQTPKLYYYELEALLASCIAALTFTFLNKLPLAVEIVKQDGVELTLNSNTNNIKDNIKKYSTFNIYHNMYDNLKKNKDRTLQLKSHFNMENLQKNKNQFENAIQIYAEFQNILIMNSYILQTLNLKDFASFYSMYHFLWEEAFYSMVYFFKISKNKQISFIFNHLFNVNSPDENNKNFINYLEDTYLKVLNAIVTV